MPYSDFEVDMVTEKEKMQKQMLYDANHDKELMMERYQAKDLCHEYNQLLPSDEENQQAIMKRLLGKTKGAFSIVAPFWCDYGYNIEIGENFFANHNTVILDCAKVVFALSLCSTYTAFCSAARSSCKSVTASPFDCK